MEQTDSEIKRLKGCINDLISVLAIPAICSGNEPSKIISTLLDVLLSMLRLDFVYVRLNDSSGGLAPIEMFQLAQRRNISAQAQEIGQMLDPWLTGDQRALTLEIPNPTGEGMVSIVHLRLGLQDEVGLLVAGSQKPNFPTEIELLLLQVAVNQAGIQLQEARLLRKQKLAVEEIRFQAELLDAVDQAVFAIDKNGAIIYWNRFADRLYGWSAVEVIGHNIIDITPAQGPSHEAAEILSRWQHGERWTGECLVQHRNGRIFPVLVTDSPIYNSQGMLIGVVRVSIDITERKRSEEELEQRVVERTRQLTDVNKELRKEIIERKRAEAELRKIQAELAHITSLTILGEMTASIAHEVNQPLCAIVTNANACQRWLAADSPSLEKVRAALQDVVKDGRRAGDVISRIRTFLRKRPFQMVLLDINEIIQEAVKLTNVEIEQTQVLLQLELTKDLPTVFGDRVQLQQVMLNLISNSLEAMRGINDQVRELTVRSERDGASGVSVEVRDTGIGLDQEEVDLIFNTFYTTKMEGMGMGLAIGRSIIEAHGGRLWASSNRTQGAKFQFTLPIGGRYD